MDDPVVNNGVLQVAHSIFKRWRPLFRSDDLYTEINHVLTKFGGPFLTLLEVSISYWPRNISNHNPTTEHGPPHRAERRRQEGIAPGLHIVESDDQALLRPLLSRSTTDI